MPSSHIPATTCRAIICSSPYAYTTSQLGLSILRTQFYRTALLISPTCARNTQAKSFSRSRIRSFHIDCPRRADAPSSPSSGSSHKAANDDAETQKTGSTIDSSGTHYETLSIPAHASPAEIKRNFYRLSKHHHPDGNSRDSRAPRRFMKLSEAYAVLSHPEKRKAYDKSVEPVHGHARPVRKGSYHGGVGGAAREGGVRYAGGRPATGLSKRRGHFQGPPPSFFRSGGWGRHAGTRRDEHERSTQTENGRWQGNTPPPPGQHSSATQGHYAGGMGPGSDPYQFTHRDRHGAKHFDPSAHEETQRRVTETINARNRARRDYVPRGDIYSGMMRNFVAIAAVLLAIIVFPGFVGLILRVADVTGGGSGGDGGGSKRARKMEWEMNIERDKAN